MDENLQKNCQLKLDSNLCNFFIDIKMNIVI